MIEIVTPIDDLQREVWTFYVNLSFSEKLSIQPRCRVIETRQTKRHKWRHHHNESSWPVPDEMRKRVIDALQIEFVEPRPRGR